MADRPKADMCVVIGRFQIHKLHGAHETLFRTAVQQSDRVLVLLGCNRMITKQNPLTFGQRSQMIHQHLASYRGGVWAPKQISIVPVMDMARNEDWVAQVDGIVSAVAGTPSSVRFIWGTKSAHDIYIQHGSFTDHHTMPPLPEHALHATTIRQALRVETDPTRAIDFRAGAIWQQERQFLNPWPTVDMVISNAAYNQVLLGQKSSDGDKWRFPGGFVDVTDPTLEAAARREVREECGDIEVEPRYIGSTKIHDWRLRGAKEGIMTSVFDCPLVWGDPKAGDDLARIQWFEYGAVASVLHPVHRPIWNLFDLYRQSQRELASTRKGKK